MVEFLVEILLKPHSGYNPIYTLDFFKQMMKYLNTCLQYCLFLRLFAEVLEV